MLFEQKVQPICNDSGLTVRLLVNEIAVRPKVMTSCNDCWASGLQQGLGRTNDRERGFGLQ